MKIGVENMSNQSLENLVSQLEESTSKIQKLSNQNETLSQEKASLSKEKEILSNELLHVKYRLDRALKELYGIKKESFTKEHPYQMTLPFEEEALPEQQTQEKEKQEIKYTREISNKRKSKGIELPEDIETEEIRIEPKEDVSQMKCIGEDITELLDFEPSRLKKIKYIRPKYARKNPEGIVMGELPLRPIEKSKASPGLLSHILISKFVDHLPIYRQIQMFKRDGVKIPSSTIDSWITQTTNLLTPLYHRLIQKILSEGYLQVDESPIKVLDKQKKQKTHRGYHWVYHAPLQNAVFFDYRQGRNKDGPMKLLEDFKGYLQTDGYSVYDIIGRKKDVTLVGCMAHARRKFYEALDYDKNRAELVLSKIQQLYAVEKRAREDQLSFEQRKELRLKESLPVLNELGDLFCKWRNKLLPSSILGKAIEYSTVRWDKLQAYLYDGALEIDNNLIENAIRPNALGRKNYLFAGSHDGARRAAMMYSFFGTCKMNNINPFIWLKKVLEIIPEYPANRLQELFPQNLKLD